jgi:hypothetical protein
VDPSAGATNISDVTRPLPIEFQPSTLVERMILGAVNSDPVRLHGAIVAALEIHGITHARTHVFTPALIAAHDHNADVSGSVAAAIHSHLT